MVKRQRGTAKTGIRVRFSSSNQHCEACAMVGPQKVHSGSPLISLTPKSEDAITASKGSVDVECTS